MRQQFVTNAATHAPIGIRPPRLSGSTAAATASTWSFFLARADYDLYLLFTLPAFCLPQLQGGE